MLLRIYLIFLFCIGFIIPGGCIGQADKNVATNFAVRIFSSTNFMGYLEPCG